MTTTEIDGVCDAKFAAVKDAFAKNFAEGLEVGASFAATVNGEIVVDLWGGDRDEHGKPWERDTIVNVYSTTKTMTALSALLLADRGQLDVHAPVARYWPEFAANGKADVKVSHLLAHASGLSGWEAPLKAEDLYDWDKATSLLAAQAPWWKPGERSGYHAITQGYLVGEVVRRISGKSLGTFFREELAQPLGADFWIGLPASEDARVGDLIPPPRPENPPPPAPAGSIAAKMGNPAVNALEPRTRAWRAAEIPAAGGIGNARSVAQVQTVLANLGAANGKRIISEAGARRALELQIDNVDLVFGTPIKFGLGYGLPGEAFQMLPHRDASCFWGGWGGSIVMIDMEARACIAYVPNKMGNGTMGDLRGFRPMRQVFAALS